jgi:hypothetical protein
MFHQTSAASVVLAVGYLVGLFLSVETQTLLNAWDGASAIDCCIYGTC